MDGHAYWDGIFASNPPVMGFLQRRLMGTHPVPDEIWIIQVNRTKADAVPETPSDIFDRRNHLAGNLSLGHELRFIETVNMLLQENALTERFRARFGLETTESHHRALHPDVARPAGLARLSQQAVAAADPHRPAEGGRCRPDPAVPGRAGRRPTASDQVERPSAAVGAH